MDRQDIDALLIGALYGELTPADEARLATHLESHPTDRGALDDLKSARQAVQESRIFEVQLDPPQALSALLLQEAHRRAPKRVVNEETEGWFYRFARSFMAHPAMAAAAMLVVVVGVAGTLYMKGGAEFAEQQVATPATAEYRDHNSAPAVEMPTVPEGAAGSAAIATGSAFNADLYEAATEDRGRDELQDRKAAKNELSKDSAATRWKQQEQEAQVSERSKKKANKGIRVQTEQGAPKELDGKLDLLRSDDAFARPPAEPAAGAQAGPSDSPANVKGGWGGGAGAATGSTTATTTPRAPAPGRAATQPAPPPPPAAAPAKKPAPAPTTVAKPTTTTSGATKPADKAPTAKIATKSDPKPEAAAPAQEPKKDESTLMAWAKSQHNSARTLVQKGDCTAAARIALSVSNRASDYYAQNMATDRALKQCMVYINAERDKDAERSGKARAQKRVNADEPARAAPAESAK